jgi:hypothetical protein
MIKFNKIIIVLFIIIIFFCIQSCRKTENFQKGKVLINNKAKNLPAFTKKIKILHIMSYHSPWEWTDVQLEGFKDALKGLNIEYKIFQMDTKRHNSKEWLEQKGTEACSLIESWKPDLVYTSDDNAQQYVTRKYINSKIPFVFSAVNADPEDYGFVESRILPEF